MPAPQRRAITPLRLAAIVAAVAALVVTVLGLAGSASAPRAGAVLAAVLPLAAAVALWRPGRTIPAHQRLFAAAFGVAGGAQALRVAAAMDRPPGHGPPFPTAGDLLAIATIPLAIAGLVAFTRAVPGLVGVGLPAVRLLLDAVLLGLSLTLLLWRSVYQHHASGAVAVLLVVLVLAYLVVGCTAGLLALRGAGPPLLAATMGLGAVLVGRLLALQAELPPAGRASWPGLALICAGWPLMAGGLLGYLPGPARRRRDPPLDAEPRLTTVTTTGTVVVLAVAILSLVMRPPVDAVSVWLVLVLVLVVWVREVLATGSARPCCGACTPRRPWIRSRVSPTGASSPGGWRLCRRASRGACSP
jgi:hypothetical protein